MSNRRAVIERRCGRPYLTRPWQECVRYPLRLRLFARCVACWVFLGGDAARAQMIGGRVLSVYCMRYAPEYCDDSGEFALAAAQGSGMDGGAPGRYLPGIRESVA